MNIVYSVYEPQRQEKWDPYTNILLCLQTIRSLHCCWTRKRNLFYSPVNINIDDLYVCLCVYLCAASTSTVNINNLLFTKINWPVKYIDFWLFFFVCKFKCTCSKRYIWVILSENFTPNSFCVIIYTWKFIFSLK